MSVDWNLGPDALTKKNWKVIYFTTTFWFPDLQGLQCRRVTVPVSQSDLGLFRQTDTWSELVRRCTPQ